MKHALRLGALVLPVLLSRTALAQDVLYITDPTGTTTPPIINEMIYRCVDLNSDGDLNDAGEAGVFYEDAVGGFDLSNNVGITKGPAGVFFVCDTSNDIVLRLQDLNNDNDANDGGGEASVFFDGSATLTYGGNAAGILMTSANSLYYDPNTNVVWCASANTGTAGTIDDIIRLEDLNMDGDANDALEATIWWQPPAAVTGVYNPEAVYVDSSGVVLFTDDGTIGKGVYSLTDLNMDGDALDAGEYLPFFVLPIIPNPTQQVFHLDVDAAGYYYMADFQYDIVYRFKDLNADGDAMDAGESNTWWTPPTPSTIWDIAFTPTGTAYASDNATTGNRVMKCIDANNDGMIGAGEYVEVYNQTLAPLPVINNGRGIVVVSPNSTVSTPLCLGDGTDTPCPCTNNGLAGRGCDNTVASGGAALASSGIASISADTLVLNSTFAVPFGPGLYYEGSTTANPIAPFGVPFGNGLRCAGGNTNRLEIRFADSLGAASTTVSLAAFGAAVAGNTYYYQLWYRDTGNVGTCLPGAGFNFSGALSLAWVP